MNNLVLERIKGQTEAGRASRTKPVINIPPEPPKPVSHPIDPEELRKLFVQEIQTLTPQVTPQVTSQVVENAGERVFKGVQDFANWYETAKDSFSEPQQAALNTLVDARNIIPAGCECQKHHRRIAAEDYYSNFWIENQHNDLAETVARVLNVPVVRFEKFGEMIFAYTKN